MKLNRKNFIKTSLASLGAGLLAPVKKLFASQYKASPEWMGVLVDTTACIGCRRCEWSCQEQNKLGKNTEKHFQNKKVFEKMRRPTDKSYTVVNKYNNPQNPIRPYFVKVQCMHCNFAACVSACIVGALAKDKKTGAVIYDAWKCIGCRYCMVACPFQIPAYEYDNALTPQVRKCILCFDKIKKEGEKPACVTYCPTETLIYGKREELIKLAHSRIEKYKNRYVNHVYGEHELGGTSWLYISGQPMTKMDMIKFEERPIPDYTEPVQHGIFKYFIPPVALFTFLSGIMFLFKKDSHEKDDEE